MLEREVKLAVAPSFRFPDLTDVAASVQTSPVDERRLETVYYDTPDLRLARWDCSLRLRQGEGWTLKLPSPSTGATLTRRELEFQGPSTRPPDAALALIVAYVRRATLVPVASLSTLRRRVQMKNQEGGVLAEVVDDDVTVIQGLRVQHRFREIEVELRDPHGDEILQPILARLHGAGAADEGKTSKLLRALGSRAAAPPEVDPLPVTEKSTTTELIRNVIATSVASLMRHDPGVRLGDDIEDVHRARVATRRLRSQLRTFRPLLDRAWADRLREDLRWVGNGLGGVRDRQVMSGRLRARAADLPDEDAAVVFELASELEAESEEARGRLVLDMRSDRYLDLIERLVQASRAPVFATSAEEPAVQVMPSLVRRDFKRLRNGVKKLPDTPANSELHRIRIFAKRLRYAAEAASAIAGKPALAQAQAATELQDILGDHQDSITLQRWLRQSATGPRAFVAGELTAMERDAATNDRGQWRKKWKNLDRKPLKKWMI